MKEHTTRLIAMALATASLTGGLTAPAMAATPATTQESETGKDTGGDVHSEPSLTAKVGDVTVTFTREQESGGVEWRAEQSLKETAMPDDELTADYTTFDKGPDPMPALATITLTVKPGSVKSSDTTKPNGQTVTTWSGEWEGVTPAKEPIHLTLSGRVTRGADRTNLDRAIRKANRRLDSGEWLAEPGVQAVKAAVKAADTVEDTEAADQAAKAIDEAVKALKPVSFTVTAGDVTLGSFDSKGRWTPAGDLTAIPDTTAVITPKGKNTGFDPVNVTLKGSDQTATPAGLGRVTVTGKATGTHDDKTHKPLTVSVAWRVEQGEAVTVDGITSFDRNKDGLYVGALQVGLNAHNTPVDPDTGARVDGIRTPGAATPVALTWSAASSSKPDEQNRVTAVQRTASLTGVLNVDWTGFDGAKGTVGQQWRIDATATRTTDAHVTASLLRVAADGSTRTLPIDDARMTLDSGAATDHYAIVFDKGPDAQVSAVQSTPLSGRPGRLFSWTQNGVKHTLTLDFKAAPIEKDSPAKLTGIYVNYSGARTKGRLIDGWNPNRLSYVLSIDKDAPSPYILPVAGDGVSVKATDTRQTADGAAQTWTVTARANGVSRRYTVTVIRQRDWMTADERFVPAQPVEIKGDVQATNTDAALESIGWRDSSGAYHRLDGDRVTIPEHGTFAYQPKTGQVATVSQVRLHGTTWRYVIGVLAPDGSTYRETRVDATYLTAATHAAALTGLKVDGRDVKGFDPARTSYRVGVANPDKWVVSPLFDRTSGMSVDTAKDGRQARITVTSADGLAKRVYTVTAADDPAARAGQVLAQTGVTGLPAAAAALFLGVLAAGVAAVRRFARPDA